MASLYPTNPGAMCPSQKLQESEYPGFDREWYQNTQVKEVPRATHGHSFSQAKSEGSPIQGIPVYTGIID